MRPMEHNQMNEYAYYESPRIRERERRWEERERERKEQAVYVKK